MKKLLSVILCVAMLMTAAVTVGASDLSSNVNDSTWGEVELKALIYMQNGWCASDLAENYDNDEWYYIDEMELTDGGFETYATLNMRGFAMSPDRKYAYLGYLNGGTALRGCAMMDMATGEITDLYYRYDYELAEANDPGYRFSFAKGIAADDRGYVYVGFALSANYNLVTLGIAQVNEEERKLNEVYNGAIYEYGTPGDLGGIHVGVNGVDVAKVGDKYLCYAMINYDVDRIVCMDVTDPAHPEPYKSFGVDGVMELGTDDAVVKLSDGNYMDVDNDGTIWLCAKDAAGATKVMKLAPDGSALAASFECDSAYAVAHAGSYLVVVAKDGSYVSVFDDSSFEKVADVKFDAEIYGTFFSMVQVIDDILFVIDSDTNDGSAFNAILAAPLTAEAQGKLDEMVDNLNGKTPGSDVPGDTEAESDTEAPTVAETEAPTAADATEAPTAADGETLPDGATAAEGSDTAASGDTGCASVIGGSVTLLLTAMAAAVALKKKN